MLRREPQKRRIDLRSRIERDPRNISHPLQVELSPCHDCQSAIVSALEQYRPGRERRLRLLLPLCVDLLENSGLVVLRAGVFLYEEPQYYTVLVKRRYLDSVLSSSKIRFATIF